MKRCSFCEWIPILPWPVWPLAEQCSLGQNVVVGSMLVLQVALGNVPRGVCLDPRLHYKCTSPRLPAELPIKSRIKENGEYTLLGQLTVRLDQARDHYWADVPALGDNTVRVGPKILEQYRDVLMTSGAWGTMVIEYDATYGIKSRKYPFYVRE